MLINVKPHNLREIRGYIIAGSRFKGKLHIDYTNKINTIFLQILEQNNLIFDSEKFGDFSILKLEFNVNNDMTIEISEQYFTTETNKFS